MEYTKGPWTFEGGDNASVEVNIGDTTANISRADKNTGIYIISRDEMIANGKLIAAAPDLLEALHVIEFLHDAVFSDTAPNKQGVLYAFNHAEITYEDLRKAKAAIIKATI